MYPFMPDQVWFLCESFITQFTFVGLLSCMRSHMNLPTCTNTQLFSTHGATISRQFLLPTIPCHLRYQHCWEHACNNPNYFYKFYRIKWNIINQCFCWFQSRFADFKKKNPELFISFRASLHYIHDWVLKLYTGYMSLWCIKFGCIKFEIVLRFLLALSSLNYYFYTFCRINWNSYFLSFKNPTKITILSIFLTHFSVFQYIFAFWNWQFLHQNH